MKKKQPSDPFKDLVLDEEEQAIEDAIERGEFVETPETKQITQMLQAAAKRHVMLHKKKPITVRIKTMDLIKLKAKAKQQNLPYQTLLGLVIHEYAEGNVSLKL